MTFIHALTNDKKSTPNAKLNMFSYFGSKSKIIDLYPKPQHSHIIEPFAGSARYSLKYFENDVTLFDVSNYVCEVWKYLIEASPKDIKGLPLIETGKTVLDYELTSAERSLIGFYLCRGKSVPRKRAYARSSWNDLTKARIIHNLPKIRHWKIYQKSYIHCPNIRATWFIDAPYKFAQQRTNDKYKHYQIDYNELRSFVLSRQGFTICCEGEKADWLDFRYLGLVNGTNSFTKEYIYIQGAL